MGKVLHLGYHYVREGKAPGPTCSPARLRAQIRALKSQGYEFLTCGEVARRAFKRRGLLPERHATLSFDDGLKDQMTAALPILTEEGVPATFFVIACTLEERWPPVIAFQMAIDVLGVDRLTKALKKLLDEIGCWSYRRLLEPGGLNAEGMKMGEPPEMRLIKAVFNHYIPPSLQAEIITELCDRYPAVDEQAGRFEERFLNADDLQKIIAAGEIASHTTTHPWLNMIGAEEIEAEGRRAMELLSSVVPRPRTFAWTFGGDVRREAQAAIFRAGYESAWNFRSGWNMDTFRRKDIYANLLDIPRLHEQAFNP